MSSPYRPGRCEPLLEEHRPLFRELLERLASEELIELAKLLPFDQRAADAVCPRIHGIDRTGFVAWLDGPTPKAAWVATYCAAAAQWAAAKVLEEMLELSRQRKAKFDALRDLLGGAEAKGARELQAAIKRSE